MPSSMMKSDTELQRDVIEELDWEPSVNAADIGVTVSEGVVTLTGHVDSYSEKKIAERVTKRVTGVRAVADELEVKLSGVMKRTDAEIAKAAVEALRWNMSVPHEQVTVTVDDGVVTLEGEVDWHYQQIAAEDAVRNLTGVRWVHNQIVVAAKTQIEPEEIKAKIKRALERSAEIDARKITVETLGDTVILSGKVRSHAEREDAVQAALSAPGVAKVENYIVVSG